MIGATRLIREMPCDYVKMCYEKKAMQRKRGIENPDDLMMLSLIHLLNGCSLMEISEIARLAKLGEVSDVAFMKRFEKCNDWFKWIISQIVSKGMIAYEKPKMLEKYRVLAIDASDVAEKGRSGRLYRLHFALNLFQMEAVHYNITTNKVGETLRNFTFEANDLVVGDRIYGTIVGMEHCLKSEANFVLRLRSKFFKMYASNGKAIDLLEQMHILKGKETLDLGVDVIGNDGDKFPIRICAMRKPQTSSERTKKALHRKESKKQEEISEETKEFNEYIVLVTALPEEITAEQVLKIYRLRWQVEIYFKRLKSILDFGELPKKRHESVMAWLNGKLMIALLIEKIIGESDFSPYGELNTEHMA